LDVPEEITSYWWFLFFPPSWSAESAGEETELSQFPLKNSWPPPHLDFWRSRGLQDRMKRFLRLAALLREVGDVKSEKGDPVTRQIKARNKRKEIQGKYKSTEYLFGLQNWYLWQGICGIKRNY
jgi:hypothetical protein